MQRFKHSIASVSLSGTLIEKVKAVAKAGYDGIELFENDLLVSNIPPRELNNIVTDLGLEIVALQPFRDYEAMPEPFKSRNLERAKHKFDLMHALGTKKLFICSNTSIHTINNPEKAAQDLFDIAELAKQHDFEIGYEALSWGRFVKTYHQSIDIVRRANHPNLGNILDNFHISVLNSTFEDIYTIPAHKFTIVQVADAPKYDMGAMHLGRHYRCFPGQGSFPVVEFMDAVCATGYKGYLSHEIFSDEFRSSLVEPIALDGKRSLNWLEEVSNKKQSKSVLTGIEFIEFSSNSTCENALIEMFENLGFVESHRHKTKDVSLFQVGNVNFVVNRQTHSQTEHQQNAVCAIGLVTDNYKNFQDLAAKLPYQWQESKALNNELNISAVKGIGEMLFYFVEQEQLNHTFYEIEFDATNNQKINNGITQIDHLGHSVGADFYQSNTLFYRALLGLDVEESLEILDPRGIVYSRVAKNKEATIRISLSSSRSQGTLTDQFISHSGKAGIQQIALQSDDIFLTASLLCNKDLILPIPSNYYDDLRAKTSLSAVILQQMQQNNILYDEHETGSFFHFYCKELNGLFIEIVQRNGAYNRYGEVNAQVRLAAQARGKEHTTK
jgi:4-hydroxyphenylpyruvate dioxygenase